MKTAEELLMEFIAKYASHWIGAEDDFEKDLDKLIETIQSNKIKSHELPTEEEIIRILEEADIIAFEADIETTYTDKRKWTAKAITNLLKGEK